MLPLSCWTVFWVCAFVGGRAVDKFWKVYMLRCGDGSLYTGIAVDVQARFHAHSTGKGAKYTRGRGPLELVYQEECGDKGTALKREYAIKMLTREEKLNLIQK